MNQVTNSHASLRSGKSASRISSNRSSRFSRGKIAVKSGKSLTSVVMEEPSKEDVGFNF